MPRPQRPDLARAPRLVLALALLCAAPAFAAEPPPPGAGLDGRWLGTAGSERDRVVFGVEIARREDGATDLRFTLPVANFYGLAAWGEVRREGARLEVEALGLVLELVDGRLVGSFPEPGSPVALEPVAELPAAPPWPDLPAGPEPLWRAQLGAPVFASPAVADGVVYVGTTGGLLLAVDAATGRLVWAFRAGRPIHGAALVAGDALYFVCDDGYLYKLARADGEELWRYDLGDARVPRIPPHPQVFDWDWQAPTPTLADGVVHVGSGDGSFHAVDAATGARRWRFETGGRIRNGAALDGARVIFGSADHHVYALDRSSGRELWRHDTGGEIDATPVVVGERVLVAARGAGLLALSTATGETLWSHLFWSSWVESTAVVEDGVAYVGSSDLRRVTALDPADGRVLWRTDVGGWSWGTPLVADDRVWAAAAAGNPYFVEHRAGLVALDRATGRPLWRHPLDEPEGAFLWGVAGSPARAGDRVIVATLQGALLAFPAEPAVSGGAGSDSVASAGSRGADAAGPCPAEMARIPAGTFEMGSDRGREDEKPAHPVTVAAFCIDRTEVTVAAYAACVREAGCSPAPTTVDWPGIEAEAKALDSLFCNGEREDRQQHPVNCVDWYQADAYCRALGKRLPTEEEWEYAARGPDGREYPWGDEAPGPERLNTCDAACVAMGERLGHPGWGSMFPGSDGWESTAPVGSYPQGASAFGVLDMAGNVWEWTSSRSSADYRSPRTDERRVYRGGAWGYHDPFRNRTAYRGGSVPAYHGADLGFRCARTP